jgi:hypothetical protein
MSQKSPEKKTRNELLRATLKQLPNLLNPVLLLVIPPNLRGSARAIHSSSSSSSRLKRRRRQAASRRCNALAVTPASVQSGRLHHRISQHYLHKPHSWRSRQPGTIIARHDK